MATKTKKETNGQPRAKKVPLEDAPVNPPPLGGVTATQREAIRKELLAEIAAEKNKPRVVPPPPKEVCLPEDTRLIDNFDFRKLAYSHAMLLKLLLRITPDEGVDRTGERPRWGAHTTIKRCISTLESIIKFED